MTIAKMVREMIAKGVDPDVIELAVATAESALSDRVSADSHVTERDVTLELRRESDRVRKRRSRDKQQMSRDNRDMSRDVTNASLSKEEKKEDISEREAAPSRVTRTNRGQRLPDDWAPTAQDIATADELLGSPERRRAELEKFRDHWKQQPGSKGVKLDWDAAWRNWVRRAAEYRGGTNGQQPRGAQQRRSANDAFFAGIASVAADLNGHGEASGPAREEIPLGRHNIDG